MALPPDPKRWFANDLAALERRIARERRKSPDVPGEEPPLDQSERRFRLLVENSLGLICTHDLDGVVTSVNPAAAESLGYEPHEGIGHNLREFLSPATRHLFDDYLARIRENGSDSGVMRVVRKDGQARLWLYRNVLSAEPGVPPYVLGHAIDVSERVAAELELRRSQQALQTAHDELEVKVRERTAELVRANEALRTETEERARLEQRLREAQKLEATGRVASGVAHAFNNLLTIIMGSCELLRADLEKDSAIALVDDVMRAASRGATLTAQLLAVGERQVLHRVDLDLNAIVSRLEDTFIRLVGPRISIRLTLSPSLPGVVGDAAQIEQVLLNLVANARDAIPDRGTITISTSVESISNTDTRVILTVNDTGRGMDDHVKLHLFEPFFTTKGPGTGLGLGLGLPTVRGIVHQHGGSVSVASEPGRGTTFTIALPAGARVTGGRDAAAAQAPSGGTETILIVDDESHVRLVMRTALRRKGYTVLDAPSGGDALRMIDAFPGRVDLLVTDVVMPGMDGRELFEQLSSRRPGLKVLFVSGYSADVFRDVNHLAQAPFLPKPFLLETLVETVREILHKN